MFFSGGKVDIAPFEDQPHVFRALWEGADARSKTFRKYSRQMNNALSLASLKCSPPPPLPGGSNYRPSVTIQGKVFIGMGHLHFDAWNHPNENKRQPMFAQLYVLDPDHADKEHELRLKTLFLPDSVTNAEKRTLEELLQTLQAELRQHNPYVADFKFASEILQRGNPPTVQLILDERQRPAETHERQYNQGYKEISGTENFFSTCKNHSPTYLPCIFIYFAVLTNDQEPDKRSFVVTLRADQEAPVKEIQDTHRSADPLHFVLLFPTGQDGWTLQLTSGNPLKKNPITAMEFYAYHLQLRPNHPNTIFR